MILFVWIISWRVNNNDDGFAVQADVHDTIEYSPQSDPEGLETSVLGIKFQVEPLHFRGGIMELKCTATIGNGYWVTQKAISDASINAQPSIPGHNHLTSGGCTMYLLESIYHYYDHIKAPQDSSHSAPIPIKSQQQEGGLFIYIFYCHVTNPACFHAFDHQTIPAVPPVVYWSIHARPVGRER